LAFASERHRYTLAIVALLALVLPIGSAAGEGKLLFGEKVVVPPPAGEPVVRHRCLTPEGNEQKLGAGFMDRAAPWSLPAMALPIDFDTTIHCLVLRFNFQYESTDDPNTTGRGWMELSRPLDSLTDSAYIARVGHLIDPPPHDSAYFDAHLKALSTYWEFVSDGKVHLTWDIYPPYRDSVYQLPNPMNHYGQCDFADVVTGLENYFVDCLQLADTAHLLHPSDEARWDIDFSQYQAFFLFHAGSDRQSDIGFPLTCSDLFTGFIRFGGSVQVDNGATRVNTALMMPETCVQDNRVTALNAVLAHEFGHQLGLVDLYSSATFMTQLGDFALMDNNGFGVGIDFGFPAGSVFGAVPLYPVRWSRAFLGFVDGHDLRRDTSGRRNRRAACISIPVQVGTRAISETEYTCWSTGLSMSISKPAPCWPTPQPASFKGLSTCKSSSPASMISTCPAKAC
jgi:M6 family metalloprotease-like protein